MNAETIQLLVLIIIFVSALIRAVFGFGHALVAMPLLAMIVGVKIAAPLVALVAGTMALAILIENRRHLHFTTVWQLTVSSLIGIPIGLVFLKEAYEPMVNGLLAVVIIIFSLYHLVRPKVSIPGDDRLAFLFGFLAGILGGAYNTNGPPIIIYATLKKWPPESFRTTLQGCFLVTSLFIIAGHGMAGLFTATVFRLFIISLPVLLLAVYLGGKVNRSIPQRRFEQIVFVFLLVIGGVLLIRSIGS
ncbi:MAG: sulfite exporter TauE/SafE family protein [Pseudomonadota bacterium]